ncbi:MAG: YbjN domain-containing protein [Alphaproteobacteria bacterium]|nr:YbjN domain-containing protein [Alphaproteobacteria bacterium]
MENEGVMLAENLCKYNPIDDVECLFRKSNITERRSPTEVVVELNGKWDNMLLFFAWEQSMNCLHISCLLNLQPKNVNLPSIFELLALINEDLWVGYFSYWEEMQMPVFKHSLFISETEFDISEKISNIVNIAVTECERAYPIFHAVLRQNISPRRALMPSVLM